MHAYCASGIGKSIFYAYFFERYSREFPDATIVMAAFARNNFRSHMKDVVAWKAGKMIARVDGIKYIFMNRIKQETTGRMIHLYDGTPVKAPAGVDMICFTRPDKWWLDEIEQCRSHKLIMPLWSEGELLDAHTAALRHFVGRCA